MPLRSCHIAGRVIGRVIVMVRRLPKRVMFDLGEGFLRMKKSDQVSVKS